MLSSTNLAILVSFISMLAAVLAFIIPFLAPSITHLNFRFKVNREVILWATMITLSTAARFQDIFTYIFDDFYSKICKYIYFGLIIYYLLKLIIRIFSGIELNLFNRRAYRLALERALLNNRTKDFEIFSYELEKGFERNIKIAKKASFKPNKIFKIFLKVGWVKTNYNAYCENHISKSAQQILYLVGDIRFCKYMAHH